VVRFNKLGHRPQGSTRNLLAGEVSGWFIKGREVTGQQGSV
jgi:hypothetical protein